MTYSDFENKDPKGPVDGSNMFDVTPSVKAEDYKGFTSVIGEKWSARARVRLVYIGFCFAFLLPLQSVMRFLPGKLWWYGAGLCHRLFGRALGIRVNIIGDQYQEKPTLFVANHVSWLDIIILGSVLKRSSFVAKSEISEWGLVGYLTKLHRTLFVNRERKGDSGRQVSQMMHHLAKGNGLILFPEGTSTLGQRVDPFKSSLFGVVEMAEKKLGTAIPVQPISIAYTAMDGLPLIRQKRPLIAWVGDMELLNHAQNIFDSGSIDVTLVFHDPLTLEQSNNRKQLSREAEQAVAKGLDAALRNDVTKAL